MNPEVDVLGFPIAFLLSIVASIIGILWLRRITRGAEDGDDHWRYRR